jgi:hypothetical protein
MLTCQNTPSLAFPLIALSLPSCIPGRNEQQRKSPRMTALNAQLEEQATSLHGAPIPYYFRNRLLFLVDASEKDKEAQVGTSS